MKRFAPTAIALSLIFLVSCMVGALKQTEIDPWLATISGGDAYSCELNELEVEHLKKVDTPNSQVV